MMRILVLTLLASVAPARAQDCTARSTVGAIVSRYCQHDWVAENGGYTTRYIEREGPFSLIAFADASGQSGDLAEQILTGRAYALDGDALGAAGPSATCSAAPLAARPFAEIARELGARGCTPPHADPALWADPAVHLERFWLERWDGEHVTLYVQIDDCSAQRSTCTGAAVRISLRPPAEWIPMLVSGA